MGIEHDSVSPGAKEILCRMGMVQDFAQATEDARRIGGLAICRERLRLVVEAEAQSVARSRDTGRTPAGWTALDTAIKPGGPRRIYAGVDGVMVRTVTQAEKDKRRKSQGIRRRQRGRRGVVNRRPLAVARPGSDEAFKEMKIGVFYDQAKAHRHAFATSADHRALGALLKGHARQVGFEGADETISLTDGAKWIARQVCRSLPKLGAMLLDFYHLSQHVHQTAQCCFGDTPAAKEWAVERLREIKQTGIKPVLAATDALTRKVRGPAKRKSVRLLREYLSQRWEMLDYPAAITRGWDIGSGPTEATCKTLTLRLKRPGMKWDADHAAHMMNLVALYESGQARDYWNRLSTA